ncbi:MAG: thioredoxin [Micavibrio sp.]
MILGLGQKPAAKPAANEDGTGSALVVDTNTENFERDVIMASMQRPVLVDFWAPWCGPCKQLMPMLEAAVTEAAGKVGLVKVNIDDNPELAQALRIQSVPTVFAFYKGQPVTAFAGVRPASEIKAIIDQLSKMGQQGQVPPEEQIDVPATLKQAGEALAQGQIEQAQGLYDQVLQQEESNAAAYAGIVRTFIAMGELEQAADMITHVPDEMKNDPQMAAVKSALDLASRPAGNAETAQYEQALAQDADNHQARFDLAVALFAAGEKERAIDELVTIIRKNRTWEEEKARKQLLQFFDALGPVDPLTIAGRRKLSSVLFS